MKVKDHVFKLRYDLNDLDKDWFENDEILVSYFAEGLCQVWTVKPELFAKTVNMPLQAGNIQRVNPCCRVLDVAAITNEQGAFLADVTKANTKVERRWTEPCCATNDKSRTWATGHSEQEFTVYPAIPRDSGLYVRAEVSCKPNMPMEADEDADYPCLVADAALQWALYRAFSSSHDSRSAMSRSQLAYQSFHQMLSLSIRTDKRVESEG